MFCLHFIKMNLFLFLSGRWILAQWACLKIICFPLEHKKLSFIYTHLSLGGVGDVPASKQHTQDPVPEGHSTILSCPGAGRASKPRYRPTGNIPRPPAHAHPLSPSPTQPLCLPGTPAHTPGLLPPHGVPAHPLLPFGAGCAHQCPHTHPTSTHTHNTLSNSTVPCAGPAQSLLVNVGPPQMPRAESGAASSPSSFTLSFPTEQVPIR